MKRKNNLPLILAILSALFLGLLVMVANNDGGSATEVALLNGSPIATATDSQCDAMYEAIWLVKGEKNHYQLIQIAEALDCPFEDE